MSLCTDFAIGNAFSLVLRGKVRSVKHRLSSALQLGSRANARLDANLAGPPRNPTRRKIMEINVNRAVTALLDTPGVHPGDDRWLTARDAFFDALMSWDNKTLDQAMCAALDHLGIDDGDPVRLGAMANFNKALTASPFQKSSGMVGKGLKALTGTLFAQEPKKTKTKEGGDER